MDLKLEWGREKAVIDALWMVVAGVTFELNLRTAEKIVEN